MTSGAVNARCFLKELTPLINSSVQTYGGYFCVQRRGSGTNWSVRGCSTSTGTPVLGLFTNSQAATASQDFYESWNGGSATSVSSISSASNSYVFLWSTPAEPCANKPSNPESPFCSSSPNGSGPTCFEGCAYDVAVSYIGTWPSGRLQCSTTSLNRECEPNDKDPAEPPGSDDPPLDLDGQTPDTGPDPSDGSGEENASGGGTCASPPVCTGNAIQCSILFQTWATRCRDSDGEGEDLDLTEVETTLDEIEQNQRDAWNGSDDIGPGSDGNFGSLVGTKTFSSSDLNASGLGFPRSCPYTASDPTITVGEGSVTLPFSSSGVCSIYAWSGYLVVALAAFLGCFILIKD